VDDSDKQNKLRMVGGAILFSTVNPETQETTWMTGITKDGISASLITTGRLDTGAIQIMSGDTPVFRWDAYGISAYDALWNKTDAGNIISGINKNKFVRFDKNGIYGINSGAGVDGSNWHPTNMEQIDEKATFALTWDGLKVTGNNGVVARIGKLDNNIVNITNAEKESLLSFSNDGTLTIGGCTVGQNGFEKNISSSVSTFGARNTTNKIVYLRSTPLSETFTDGGKQTQTKELIFRAGDHFRVTKDGELFASAGKIGNLEIENIASKNDVNNVATNANLLPGTGDGTGWNDGGFDAEKREFSVNGSRTTLERNKKIQLKSGHKYTLSF
jgi:hypothetical protein